MREGGREGGAYLALVAEIHVLRQMLGVHDIPLALSRERRREGGEGGNRVGVRGI